MSQLLLNRSHSYHRHVRAGVATPVTLQVGKFFLLFGMTFMIGLLSFFYLMKSTEIQTRGFQLRKLEIERSKLQGEREVKSTEISSLRSLSSIRESGVARSLIPAKNPTFLKQEEAIASLAGANQP